MRVRSERHAHRGRAKRGSGFRSARMEDFSPSGRNERKVPESPARRLRPLFQGVPCTPLDLGNCLPCIRGQITDHADTSSEKCHRVLGKPPPNHRVPKRRKKATARPGIADVCGAPNPFRPRLGRRHGRNQGIARVLPSDRPKSDLRRGTPTPKKGLGRPRSCLSRAWVEKGDQNN